MTEEIMNIKFAYLEKESIEIGITEKAMANKIAEIEKISIKQEVTLAAITVSVRIIEYTFIAFVATNVIMYLASVFKIR
jgi:hypothetical protein